MSRQQAALFSDQRRNTCVVCQQTKDQLTSTETSTQGQEASFLILFCPHTAQIVQIIKLTHFISISLSSGFHIQKQTHTHIKKSVNCLSPVCTNIRDFISGVHRKISFPWLTAFYRLAMFANSANSSPALHGPLKYNKGIHYYGDVSLFIWVCPALNFIFSIVT